MTRLAGTVAGKAEFPTIAVGLRQHLAALRLGAAIMVSTMVGEMKGGAGHQDRQHQEGGDRQAEPSADEVMDGGHGRHDGGTIPSCKPFLATGSGSRIPDRCRGVRPREPPYPPPP